MRKIFEIDDATCVFLYLTIDGRYLLFYATGSCLMIPDKHFVIGIFKITEIIFDKILNSYRFSGV